MLFFLPSMVKTAFDAAAFYGDELFDVRVESVGRAVHRVVAAVPFVRRSQAPRSRNRWSQAGRSLLLGSLARQLGTLNGFD